jgi:hypothetical protein
MGRESLIFVLSVLAAGCAAEAPVRTPERPIMLSRSAPAASSSVAVEPRSPPSDCPSVNASARVASQPVDGGAALVFVTSPGDTAALRRRVTSLPLPESVAREGFRTDNIGNGIRLVFESEQPAGVVPLRQALHFYARDIAQRCGLTLAPPKQSRQSKAAGASSDPTTGGAAAQPGTSTPTSKPTPPADKGKATKPDKGGKKAEPSKPKPAAPGAQPPSSPPKGPTAPIPDPFKPPPPNLPSPPQNPFK